MTENREATMWNKAASGAGRNVASQERGNGRGSSALSGSVFTRGSFANAFVSFLVATLLMLQGLVVTGGTIAYAADENGTTPETVRTTPVDWSDMDYVAKLGQDDVKVVPTLSLNAEGVKGMKLTEDAFCALASTEDQTVPADVELTVNLKAPDNEVFIAGDTISFSASTDDSAVKLSDTTKEITLVDPVDSTKHVATAKVANNTLTITLLESAFEAAVEGEPNPPATPSTPSNEQNATGTTDESQTTPGGDQGGSVVEGEGGTTGTVEVGGATDEPVDQNGTTTTDGEEDEIATEGGDTESTEGSDDTTSTTTEEVTGSTLASRSATDGGESTPAHGEVVSMKATFDASMLASVLVDDTASHEWTLIKGKSFKATITTPLLQDAVTTLNTAGAFVQEPETTDPEESTDDQKPEEGEEPSNPGENDALELSGYTGTSSLTTKWCDNMSAERPKLDDVKGGYQLYFALKSEDDEPTKYVPLTEENLNKLGLQEMPSWANIDPTEPNTNEYVASASGLPTTLTKKTTTPATEEGKEPVVTTEQFTILWQVHDDNDFSTTYAGYMRMEDAYSQGIEANTQYLQKVTDVWFGIEAKIGGDDLEAFFRSEGANFLFHATANGKSVLPEDKMVTVGDLITADFLDWDEKQGALVGQLPEYTRDGYPIVYSITYDGFVPEEGSDYTGDYYQVAYDNQGSPNHGSDTTAAFSGGSMTLRRLGTTTFDATKAWLDNNAGKRPKVDFTLWRYSANQENGHSVASQVQLTSKDGTLEYATISIPPKMTAVEVSNDSTLDQPSSVVSGQGAAHTDVEGAIVEENPVEENAASEVNLGALLSAKYGNEEGKLTLPKYDPDGYPYVYALREETNLQNYEKVFGTVQANADGTETITDTAPNYYNAAGEKTYVAGDGWTRSDGDRLIYNGGTVTNRLTGTVLSSFTKTWVAATFQSQLDDIVCTFKAQSRIVGSEDDAWQDVKNAEVKLDGWISESLTQTVTKSFPKYDSQGNELEYRWIEYSVTQDGEEKVLGEDGEFSLTLTDALGTENPVTFKSVVEEDGTIKNVFKNETSHHVEKIWYDENGNEIKTPNAEITVKLYRDHAYLNWFTLNGVVDDEPQTFELDEGELGTVTYTVQETEPWHLSIEGLPEYSESGAHYSYLVLEDAVEGWHTERTYDPTGYKHEGSELGKPLTTIVNTKGDGGPTTDIPVSKAWLDDSDNDHRLPSVVKIVSKVNKDDGHGNHISVEDVVGYAVLTEEQGWYEEVTIKGAWDWQNDFELVEVGLANKNQEPAAAPGDVPEGIVEYPAYDNAGAASEANEGKAPYWANKGWSEGFAGKTVMPRIATDQHVYEVTNRQVTRAEDGEIESLNVKNRRIGLIDLTAVKIWKDGTGNEDDRPEAVFELTEVNGKATFSTDDEGYAYAQLTDGSEIPLFTDDTESQRLKGTASEDKMTLTISVDKNMSSDVQTEYHINGLPKYDGNGEVATYSLTERFPNGGDEYASSKETGEYTVHELHFHDTQEFAFTNKRVGSKDVVFHKVWKDAYVHEVLNQRPDIHLTLYRMTSDGLDPVDGYIHYVWSYTDGKNGEYYQDCTIDGLPKYDDNGEEIIYYATESMSADAEALWYTPVQLTAPKDVFAGCVNVKESNLATIQDGPLSVTGSDWAVIENGTFTNALGGTITVDGTKLWENMPVGFQLEDLPEITIYLQQREVASEAEMAAPWQDMTVESGNPSEGEAPAGDPGSGYHVEGALAWTTLSGKDNGATTWKFTMTHEGANSGAEEAGESTLPRFTEDGNLYQYRTREAIWGLMGTEGGFAMDDYVKNEASSDGETTDGTSTGEPATTDDVVSNVYKVTHGETGSFLMRNFYTSDTGELTVQKTFDGERVESDKYPDVTFDLYRFYKKGASEEISKPTLVQSFKMLGENITKEDNGFTHTFKGLEIYAPNGNEWQYFVVEHAIGGYGSTVNSAAPDKAAYTQDIDGIASDAITLSGDANNQSITFSFENTYEPNEDLFALSGTKQWQDYNNIFGSENSVERPESIELTLERVSDEGKGQKESVELQGDDEDGAAYLQWTNNDKSANKWTFTISNLERWAPDGTLWTYTVKETNENPVGYSIVKGSATVTANANEATVTLVNGLEGKLSVEKRWEDGGNEWGLRPAAVKVELQALIEGEDWGNAYEVVSKYANVNAEGYKEGLDAFKAATSDKVLKANLDPSKNWLASWGSLPVKVGGKDIQYRAVETAMSYDSAIEAESGKGWTPVVDGKTTLSYETTRVPEGNDKTIITNTLESTSLSLTKTWNDQNNKWDSRPSDGSGAWTLTFLLQSSTDGSNWSWVTKSGNAVEDSNVMTSDDVVKYTMTSANPDGYTVTLNNLPKFNADGKELTYRMVEKVPTGYKVSNGTTDKLPAGFAVVDFNEKNDDQEPNSQTFKNELMTIDLEGTKKWEDYGTNLTPDFDGSVRPDLTLYRTVEGAENSQPQEVELAASHLEWTGVDEDGWWTYAYKNLPKYDKDGKEYVYSVKEEPGSVPGFYPTYDDKAPATITNVATRFKLDKVNDVLNDEGQAESLNNVELAIVSKDQMTAYAVWQRTKADGGEATASSWVWPNGKPVRDVWQNGIGSGNASSEGAVPMEDNTGHIIGIPAGEYFIVESAPAPDNHAKVDPISLTIGIDGAISLGEKSDDASIATDQKDGVSVITVVDDVFRAHLKIYKVLASDEEVGSSGIPVGPVEFELWQDNGTVEAIDNADVKIVESIQTDEQGNWCSWSSDEMFVKDTMPGYYQSLKDGLPAGSYYLKEVAAPAGVAVNAVKYFTLSESSSDHDSAYLAWVENDKFAASVEVPKVDAQTGNLIQGAEFTLKYWSADEAFESFDSKSTEITTGITSNEDGMLLLGCLKKGTYLLTETSNDGYESVFEASFTIEDGDENAQFDLTNQTDRTAIDFTLRKGSIDGRGILNNRVSTGEDNGVELKKTGEDGTPLNGAVFKLQMKQQDNSFVDVRNGFGFVTGKSYVLNDDGTMSETDSTQSGVLRVSNLQWGTYRFVEITPAPGYHGEGGQLPVTGEFEIAQASNGETAYVTAGTIVNHKNDNKLLKVNSQGTPLKGAVFEVTPVDSSRFADGTTEVRVVETDAQGVLDLAGDLVVGGSYTFKETKAPDGYLCISSVLKVTVNANGTLTKVSGNSAFTLSEDGTTITAVDPRYIPHKPSKDPASFDLLKTDPSGNVLAGAEFTLKPVGSSTFADKTTTPKTFTTKADGTFSLGEQLLVGGTYELEETKAPEGYDTIPGSLLFTVRTDGTLAKSGTADSGYTINGSTVTAVDPVLTPPDPENPDPEGPPETEEPDPENPDPENPDPENPNPENPDPENPNPENPNPENPDPKNPNPENPDPKNPNPENPDPNKPTSNKPAKTTTTVKKTTPSKGTSVVAMAKTGDPLAMAALGSGVSTLVAAALAIAVLTIRKRREH